MKQPAGASVLLMNSDSHTISALVSDRTLTVIKLEHRSRTDLGDWRPQRAEARVVVELAVCKPYRFPLLTIRDQEKWFGPSHLT